MGICCNQLHDLWTSDRPWRGGGYSRQSDGCLSWSWPGHRSPPLKHIRKAHLNSQSRSQSQRSQQSYILGLMFDIHMICKKWARSSDVSSLSSIYIINATSSIL